MKRQFPLSLPRRNDGTLLPATLFALLLLGGLLQLAWTAEPDLPEGGVGRVAQTDTALALPRTGLNPVILDRALFSPTRNASLVPIKAGPAADTPLGGATVVGAVARGRAWQLFLKLPDGSIRTLVRGGEYRGWRLAGIADSSALFVRAGEKMKVEFGSQGPAASKDADDETEKE